MTEIPTRADVPRHETWDLSTIYPSIEAWEAEFASTPALIEQAASHRSHLGDSPARLRQALDDSMAARHRLERLIVYARLRSDEDTRDSTFLGLSGRAQMLAIQGSEQLAFFDPEVLAIDPVQLDRYMADPQLAPYRHLLDDLRRQRPHTRSIEVEEVLAGTGDLARGPHEAFGALDNADLDFGTTHDEEGNEVALTKGRYQLLLESKRRDVRQEAFTGMMTGYEKHKHTLAALYSASLRQDTFYARVRSHPSARAAALFGDNIPESVYDSLIAATREARPAIERYMSLRRRMLGLDQLAAYDLFVPLGPQPERRYEYGEACELMIDGIQPLGSEYIDGLRTGIASRWVDVRETKGKRSGAYSWGVYGSPPVMLLNWNGTLDTVYTLAHEAGHAMHTWFAQASQPYHAAGYTIFLAEIASTINEVLLTWHLLSQTPAEDVAGRFALINKFADDISATLIRQVMYAEFEMRAHALVEGGGAGTLDELSEIWADCYAAYIPGVEMTDQIRIGWSRIPHFYNAFYVYQYATGISAAIALASKIRDEGAPAAARYIDMLRAGGSDYSLAILQRAGVDLTTPEPVRAALGEFGKAVAELEQLFDSGQLAT